MRPLLFCLLAAGCCATAHAQETPPVPAKTRLELELGGHTARIIAVHFTPDGERVLSTATDNTIRIWNLKTGERDKVLRLPFGSFGPASAALSPDGKTLAVSGGILNEEGKIIRPVFLVDWRAEKITLLRTPHGQRIQRVAFSPDGKRLASGDLDGIVCVWNLAHTEKHEHRLEAHKGVVSALAFSKDGQQLVTGSTTKWARLWSLETGKNLVGFHHGAGKPQDLGFIDSVAISPDGQTILTGGAGAIRVWNANGQEQATKFDLTRIGLVAGLEFTADGKQALITGCDQYYGYAALHDVASGKRLKVFATDSTKESPLRVDVPVSAGALSADGKWAATAGGGHHGLFVWEVAQPLRNFKRFGAPAGPCDGDGATFAAEGHVIAARWDRNLKDKKPPYQCAFDLDRLAFAPLSDSNYVRESLKLGAVELVRLNATDYRLKRDGKEVIKYDINRGVARATAWRWTLLKGREEFVAGMDNGWLRFFTTKPGPKANLNVAPEPSASVYAHFGAVATLRPTADGRYLITTGSEDLVIKVWNVETRKLLFSCFFYYGGDWIVWTPEGYYAATPGGERLMGWATNTSMDELMTFHPADRFRKQLYRPDVIKLLLAKGSLAEALKGANAALPMEERPKTDVPAKVEDLLPPRVELKQVSKSDKDEVELQVKATAGVKTQPIRSLRLFVDGKPVLARKEYGELGVEKAEETLTLTLAPGQHSLTVLARSADAGTVSNELVIDCRPPTERPVLHVLAVGISKYQDKDLNLNAAENDAKLLSDAFEKGKGELYHDVRVHRLFNEDATTRAVRKALERLRTDEKAKAKAGDLVVVFFAGHGAKNEKGFFLLTHEANLDNLAGTSLPGKTLRDDLKEFPCQVLLILDACHSAGFGEKDGKKAKLANNGFKPATDDATRTFTDDEVGVAVLCAAMGYEKAEERGGNGLFTKHLADALTKQEGVPFNAASRKQYVHHLHAYTFEKVAELSGEKQHPFLHLPWTVEPFAVRKLAGN